MKRTFIYSFFSLILLFIAIYLDENNTSSFFYILSFILSSWLLLIYYESRFFNLWFIRYKSTKLLFSLLSFLILLYFSVTTASQINNIFGVDSSVFIYTQSIAIVILFLYSISGTILLIGSLSLLLFLRELFSPSKSNSDEFKKRGIFVINGFIVLFSFSNISSPYLMQEERDKLIEEISERVEFGKHLCINISSEKKAVYLDASHSKVLIKNKINHYKIVKCIY